MVRAQYSAPKFSYRLARENCPALRCHCGVLLRRIRHRQATFPRLPPLTCLVQTRSTHHPFLRFSTNALCTPTLPLVGVAQQKSPPIGRYIGVLQLPLTHSPCPSCIPTHFPPPIVCSCFSGRNVASAWETGGSDIRRIGSVGFSRGAVREVSENARVRSPERCWTVSARLAFGSVFRVSRVPVQEESKLRRPQIASCDPWSPIIVAIEGPRVFCGHVRYANGCFEGKFWPEIRYFLDIWCPISGFCPMGSDIKTDTAVG